MASENFQSPQPQRYFAYTINGQPFANALTEHFTIDLLVFTPCAFFCPISVKVPPLEGDAIRFLLLNTSRLKSIALDFEQCVLCCLGSVVKTINFHSYGTPRDQRGGSTHPFPWQSVKLFTMHKSVLCNHRT